MLADRQVNTRGLNLAAKVFGPYIDQRKRLERTSGRDRNAANTRLLSMKSAALRLRPL